MTAQELFIGILRLDRRPSSSQGPGPRAWNHPGPTRISGWLGPVRWGDGRFSDERSSGGISPWRGAPLLGCARPVEFRVASVSLLTGEGFEPRRDPDRERRTGL